MKKIVVISDRRDGSFGPFVECSNFPAFAEWFLCTDDPVSVGPSTVFLIHLPLSPGRVAAATAILRRSQTLVKSDGPMLVPRVLVHSEKQNDVRRVRGWLNTLGMPWVVLPNVNACVLAMAAAHALCCCPHPSKKPVLVVGDGVTARLVADQLRMMGRQVERVTVKAAIRNKPELFPLDTESPHLENAFWEKARHAAGIIACLPPPDSRTHFRPAFDDLFFSKFSHANPLTFVSIGHEGVVDMIALCRAAEAGSIGLARVNVFGYPRTGPLLAASSSNPRGPRLTAKTIAKNVLVSRASEDSHVNQAAWEMVHSVASAVQQNQKGSSWSADLFPAQMRRFREIAQTFWKCNTNCAADCVT